MRLLAVFIGACGLLAGQSGPDVEWRIEKVAGGLRFADGPVWTKDGTLLFTDPPLGRILKWTPGKGVNVLASGFKNPAGMALDVHGQLVVCESNARRVIRTRDRGEPEVIVAEFEGQPLNAPNDLAVRKDGLIVFTDPAFGSQEDTRRLAFYGLFRLTSKGNLTAVGRWDKRPNGVAFSPDGRVLYVSSSDERAVRAFDIDRSGNASGERVLIQGIDGVPNGLKVDEHGNIYVAARDVLVYSPAGKLMHHIQLPEKPSNLAIVPGQQTVLYVTARSTVYRVSLEAGVER